MLLVEFPIYLSASMPAAVVYTARNASCIQSWLKRDPAHAMVRRWRGGFRSTCARRSEPVGHHRIHAHPQIRLEHNTQSEKALSPNHGICLSSSRYAGYFTSFAPSLSPEQLRRVFPCPFQVASAPSAVLVAQCFRSSVSPARDKVPLIFVSTCEVPITGPQCVERADARQIISALCGHRYALGHL